MLRLVLVSIGLLCISGCIKFPLLQSKEGWIQLSAAPVDSADIVQADVDGRVKEMLQSQKDIEATWFTRSPDDYLIYFKAHTLGPSDGCGDMAFEFKRVNGKWLENRYPMILTCET